MFFVFLEEKKHHFFTSTKLNTTVVKVKWLLCFGIVANKNKRTNDDEKSDDESNFHSFIHSVANSGCCRVEYPTNVTHICRSFE